MELTNAEKQIQFKFKMKSELLSQRLMQKAIKIMKDVKMVTVYGCDCYCYLDMTCMEYFVMDNGSIRYFWWCVHGQLNVQQTTINGNKNEEKWLG